MAKCLNERVAIDARLSRTKILGGPFDDICKVEFRGSTETNAPPPLRHERYSDVLEMTFSESSFK